MKFNIYNRFDEALSVDIGEKEIEYIEVSVIGSEEYIHIHYTDGTISYHENSLYKKLNYYGSYIVPKERIQEWIDLEKVTNRTISYYRLEVFEEEE